MGKLTLIEGSDFHRIAQLVSRDPGLEAPNSSPVLFLLNHLLLIKHVQKHEYKSKLMPGLDVLKKVFIDNYDFKKSPLKSPLLMEKYDQWEKSFALGNFDYFLYILSDHFCYSNTLFQYLLFLKMHVKYYQHKHRLCIEYQ